MASYQLLIKFYQAMNDKQKLDRIKEIIEGVDNRCMSYDGNVGKTLDEMRQAEISEIYKLCKDEEESDEVEYVGGDGTARLLEALYGTHPDANITKALGGSEAQMLHDAADIIAFYKKEVRSDEIDKLEEKLAKAIVSCDTLDGITEAINMLQEYRQAIFRKAVHKRGEAPALIDDSGRVA